MAGNFNRSEFIATFKAEVDEHLSKLSKGLVRLEKKPDDFDLIKDLFRTAHTLKGVSRMMGFFEIQEIAHRIEDIFSAVTDKRLEFMPKIANVIFRALDSIKSILSSIAGNKKVTIDVTSVCSNLELCLSRDVNIPKKKSKKSSRKSKEKKENVAPPAEAIVPAGIKLAAAIAPNDSGFSLVPSEEYIRVSLSRINKLLNLLGEMLINKIKASQKIITLKKITKLTKNFQRRLATFSEEFRNDDDFRKSASFDYALETLHQCNVDAEKIKEEMLAIFENISNEALHTDPVVDELQQRMKEMRMLPCSSIFDEFPRLIRDIAYEQAKKINLVVKGEETELDKKVLEGIKSPLVHILRNCVDHGIETLQIRSKLGKNEEGTIELSASQEGGQVVIRIHDDGKGLDLDKIKQIIIKKNLCSEVELSTMSDEQVYTFIFKSGFSTSPIITDISGRGIGLDVVKSQIDKLKGKVHIESEKGKGVLIALELPLTIAIIDVLLVRVGNQVYAVPMLSIEEALEIETSEISTVENKLVTQVRGHAVSLSRLGDILGIMPDSEEEKDKQSEKLSVIIAKSLDKRVGFIVDSVIGEQEVFIKSLGVHLGKVRNVSGATVLGAGEVIVILDVADLISSSRLSSVERAQTKAVSIKEKVKKKILVVEDSLTTRELERSILEAEGYLVDTAIDGLEGLDKLTQAKYDLIVCDIQMPRMDGFEFCRTFKQNERYGAIPIVFVTALAKEEDKRRGIDVGAQAYIVKSAFDQSNLIDTIQRLIG